VQLVSPINSGQPHAIDRLSGAGTVNATQTSLFLGNLNGSSTFDGTILGGIVKSGSGTLTLTGDRTEATAIWGGTLQIGNGGTNGSLSVGVDISSGATLAFNRSDDVTYAPANLLTGAGGIAQNGTGVLTLGGALAYSGPTTVNAGTLRVTTATSGLPSATSVAVASGATFDVAMSGSSQGISGLSGAGRVTLSGGTLQVGYQDASSTFAGVISGSGNFEKVGNGTLQLSGANTLTGATRVYAGTLRLLATNSLSANSDVRVESTLDLNGRNQTIGALDGSSTGRVTLGGATLTVGANNHNGGFSGVISGAGSLTKTGAGGLTLFGANTYSGATNIDAGTLIVGGVNALPSSSAVTVASNALLELDRDTVVGSLAGAGNVFLNGARTLTVNTSTSSTFSGMIYDGGSGRLVKNGSGVLRLTGANQYLGGTTVNDGVLTVGAPGGSTGSLMGDVTLNRTGDGTFLSGSGSVGNVTLNSGTEIQAYGTFHTGSLTFAGDNGIDVLMSAATGTAGSLNAGWSLLSSSGAITFGGPVTVYLGSVVGQSGGAVPDWDAAANHTFLIASTDLGITGFDANQFSVNTSAFANAFTGTWAVSQMGNNLFLNYTAGASAVPEPATYAAWLGALALGTSAWRRRRASV
jgi:autotransporter-associated beta strand protein